MKLFQFISILIVAICWNCDFGRGKELDCDPTDPICQKFKQMLNSGNDNNGQKLNAVQLKSENQPNNNGINCDATDPICQKFQNMLQDQREESSNDNNERKGMFGGFGGKKNCTLASCQAMSLDLVCYASGDCKPPVDKEKF